jgi:hypothetical protein
MIPAIPTFSVVKLLEPLNFGRELGGLLIVFVLDIDGK